MYSYPSQKLSFFFLFFLLFTTVLAQDDPCTAPLIRADGACTTLNIEAATTGTPATVAPTPTCGAYLPTAKDVWYRVVVPGSASLRFNVNGTGSWTIWDAAVAVYRPASGTCPDLVLAQVGCSSTGGSIARLDLGSPAIVAGETLYVRVFEENGNLGQVDLCIIDRAPLPPVHDNPCTARLLLPGTQLYDHSNGCTVTAGVPNPGCGGYANSPDVWYKVPVPSTGALSVGLRRGTIGDGNLAVYRRNPGCGTLELLLCDDISGPGLDPEVNLIRQTAADTVMVRVWRSGGGTGTFTMYANELPENNCAGDCAFAQNACRRTPYYDQIYGPGTDDFADPDNSPGCLAGERMTMWMRMSFAAPGTVYFTIKPLSWIDYDWALWGPDVSCGALGAPIRCSQAQPSAAAGAYYGDNNFTGMHPTATDLSEDRLTGDGFVRPLTITAADVGRMYYLRIDNWTQHASGFEIDWHGTDGALQCATPQTCVLPLGPQLKVGAVPTHDNIEVSWNLPTQLAATQLILERSDMNGDWRPLATLPAMDMTLPDRQAMRGTTYYYRLAATLADGSTLHSNVVQAQLPTSTGLHLSVYPSPATQLAHIALDVPEAGQLIDIQVFNAVGQLVHSHQLHSTGTAMYYDLPVQHWPSGTYWVRAHSQLGTASTSMLVVSP